MGGGLGGYTVIVRRRLSASVASAAAAVLYQSECCRAALSQIAALLCLHVGWLSGKQ